MKKMIQPTKKELRARVAELELAHDGRLESHLVGLKRAIGVLAGLDVLGGALLLANYLYG